MFDMAADFRPVCNLNTKVRFLCYALNCQELNCLKSQLILCLQRLCIRRSHMF